MRDAYVRTLCSLAKENKDVFALVADIGTFTFDEFKENFPGRFINVGVAEANMVGVAAGLALQKKVPFIYTIASFLTMRPYEQIRVDICYHNMNVKIVGVGAGFVYSSLGPTHHAIEDIAIMRVLPNMVILSPADPLEVEKATIAALDYNGPVYIRLGKNGEPNIYKKDYNFKIGRAVTLKEGKDATIISTGVLVNDALKIAEMLERESISISIINMHTIKPIDAEIITKTMNSSKLIVTLEEHSIIGGLGSAISEVIAEGNHSKVKFKRIGINDVFCSKVGSHDDMKFFYHLDVAAVLKLIRELLDI